MAWALNGHAMRWPIWMSGTCCHGNSGSAIGIIGTGSLPKRYAEHGTDVATLTNCSPPPLGGANAAILTGGRPSWIGGDPTIRAMMAPRLWPQIAYCFPLTSRAIRVRVETAEA